MQHSVWPFVCPVMNHNVVFYNIIYFFITGFSQVTAKLMVSTVMENKVKKVLNVQLKGVHSSFDVMNSYLPKLSHTWILCLMFKINKLDIKGYIINIMLF